MSELVSGSGVYILTQSLMEARMGARSGTQLARKLMDKFWDKVTLAKSTLGPHSKLQYQQLDPKIIKAIEGMQYGIGVISWLHDLYCGEELAQVECSLCIARSLTSPAMNLAIHGILTFTHAHTHSLLPPV